MNKKNLILILIVITSLIELIVIKPLTPVFYNFNIWGKLFVIIAMYGFPIYVILPIAFLCFLILLPKLKKEDFLIRFINVTRRIYFVLSIVILFFISLLVISKFVLNKNPFPLIPYASIKGTQEDISDIKEGTFAYSTEGYEIIRNNNTELLISKIKKDTIITDLKWISKNEYEVTTRHKNKWLKENSTRVIITNNTPKYYECYTKYGEYAVYNKMLK